MSNTDEMVDFANFYRAYKQLGLAGRPRASTAGPQNPVGVPVQRPLSQRTSIQRPFRQAPRQSTPNLLAFWQLLAEFKSMLEEIKQGHDVIFNQLLLEFKRLSEEIKQGHDGIVVVLNGIQNMSNQLKSTLEENMARMNGNIERFEAIGRGVLQMALQPSNSQPPASSSSQPLASLHPSAPGQSSSRQQASPGSSRPYAPEPGVPQPPTLAPPPHAQLYAPPASNSSDSFADPNLFDYTSAMDFLNEL